ncbi:MAG TPA: DUF2461 domain-containing protein [Ilumatobacteraceae bacterium]|nr:DUF2461 domain-containing protein [Ilumatobacteraceae bacterium]
MAFTGFPDEAFDFYERLAADNSRPFWQANKSVYEQSVRGPMVALTEALGEYGPFQIFRPYRDVRFAKDKTPYKENIAAVGETEGGASLYIQMGAGGILTGCGYYGMAADQLERFRAAIDADATGSELARLGTAVEAKGQRLGAMSELKTAPRGFPKDHPRIEFLRRKGLFAAQDWPLAKWMHTKQVVTKITTAWAVARDLTDWLDAHVGPSTLPPPDAYER